jgi:bile acid-coenzyme A ligase
MPLMSLSRVLAYHAAHKPPEAIAVSFGSEQLTWGELDRRSNSRARAFQQLGVRPDDVVAIVLPNSTLFLETAFAIWKCGATPLNIAAKLPAEELHTIIDIAKPRLLVGSDSDCAADIRRVGSDFQADGYPNEELPELTARYWKASTSGGSTGRPKIIVTHRQAIFDTDKPPYDNGMRPDGAELMPAPLYHGAPFSFAIYALGMGKRVVGMVRFDAREALRLIEGQRIDWAYLVPTMMHRMWQLPAAERDAFDLSSLQTVFHTGMKIAPWLKEAWLGWIGAHKIVEFYGGTESQGSTQIWGDEWLTHRGSVGRPVGGTRVRIVSETGAQCAPGEVGEIFFMPPGGPGSTYHYIGATVRAIEEGWESIGDLGWLDEAGYLYLADRRTDLIVRAGANIYPAEVEAALESHPDVACAIVVGLPDEDLGARVHAVVEARPNLRVPLTAEALSAHVLQKLSKYKCPHSYEITHERLRNDAGKARRTAVREAAIARLAAR